MKKIRLWPAAEGICEECGRSLFLSLIANDLPDEVILNMKKELQEELGMETVKGDFLWQPHSIICPHCGVEFETKFDS